MPKKLCEAVAEFQRISGQEFSDTPQLPPSSMVSLGHRLIDEEFTEFRCALGIAWMARKGKRDEAEALTEIADALVDLLYVVAWNVNMWGMGDIAEKLFDEVQRSNMAKFPDGQVLKDDYGKVKKPKGWKKPDLLSIITEAVTDGTDKDCK